MQKLNKFRFLILSVFGLALVLSFLAMPNVGVNYDILGYLPKDSPSTIGLNKMEELFGSISSDDTRIMVQVSSMTEAQEIKEKIRQVDRVVQIKWLDDAVNIQVPESFIPQSQLDSWYKDGYALFIVSFGENASNKELLLSVRDIQNIVGTDAPIAGGTAGMAVMQSSSGGKVALMMGLLVPIVLGIMIIATTSWLEPLLFLAVIGISILINMGTNIFLGSISSASQMTGAALQLAVSLDYSIFLLHSFAHQREQGLAPMDAMRAAMKQSLPSIIASGITTLCGFLALTLMRFGIGVDLGIVLAKGVFISLLSVVFLLPVLTMLMYKPLEKFRHRSFMPKFKGISKGIIKIGVPIMILVAFIVVPVYLGQANNDFVFASESGNADSNAIGEHFGGAEQMILLVPEGDVLLEKSLTTELEKVPHITKIMSYTQTVGIEIPLESLPKATRDLMSAGGYSRMLLTVDAAQGTDKGFALVETVRQTAQKYYGDEYFLTGTGVSIYDMRDVVTADNKVTTIAAIIAISIIILLTFKSPMLLILLVGTIEISIWINLSVPYFTNSSISFMGYMIVGAVQLGATVDYAILYCSRYLEKRKIMNKFSASSEALSETAGSILTSAAILFGAGMIIASMAGDATTTELGNLLGRGAAISALMVLLFLPNVMKLCDKLIKKFTYKSNFWEATK